MKLGNFKVLFDSNHLTGAYSCEMKLPEPLNINLLVTMPQGALRLGNTNRMEP